MPRRADIRTILVIGSGPIVIGQACEFDYSGTQACKVLRSEGFEGRAPDVVFTRAVDWIEARRLEREIDKLDREIPLASAAEQPQLLAEKRRVFDALRVKYPRFKIASRRSSAPGT